MKLLSSRVAELENVLRPLVVFDYSEAFATPFGEGPQSQAQQNLLRLVDRAQEVLDAK